MRGFASGVGWWLTTRRTKVLRGDRRPVDCNMERPSPEARLPRSLRDIAVRCILSDFGVAFP
jgi:hypothetical protein